MASDRSQTPGFEQQGDDVGRMGLAGQGSAGLVW